MAPEFRIVNRLLSALRDTRLAKLRPNFEPVSLAVGQTVYGFGEGAGFVYFPETAVLSQLCVLRDGSTIESALIGFEGMTGLCSIFDSAPTTHWTQVIVDGRALRIDVDSLRREFASDTGLQRLMLTYASDFIDQLSQKAVCNIRHRLEERMCTWLLMVHDRSGERQLPLTHEQISRHLGARRAGVSEVATTLRDRRVISYVRGEIRITNREGLQSCACECYTYLALVTR